MKPHLCWATAAVSFCTWIASVQAQQNVDDINGFRARPNAFIGDPGTVKTITPTPVSNTITPIPSTLIYHETNFTNNGQPGFQANLAEFRFSNDGGATDRFFRNTFGNQDAFDFSFNLTLEAGVSHPRKEAGIRINFGGFDGQFIVTTNDKDQIAPPGEIVAFGGILPFYSFTESDGLTYVSGETINMRMIYKPPVLNAMNQVIAGMEGTIEYIVDEGMGPVTSDPIKFSGTEGGIIDGSIVALHVQATGAPVNNTSDFVRATWSNFDLDGQDADDADFDQDGDVDGADLLALQRGLGTTSSALRSQGDADLDQDVDAVDLGIFREQFGRTMPLIAAVPEPASGLLFLIGAVFAGRFARRRRA